jgi:hypothetical protein
MGDDDAPCILLILINQLSSHTILARSEIGAKFLIHIEKYHDRHFNEPFRNLEFKRLGYGRQPNFSKDFPIEAGIVLT